MCGITGYWEPGGTGADPESTIGAMMALLHHRGPDGNGFHSDPRRGLVMGHTRLTIIDLFTGAQPLCARRGQLVLTSNGELYDYKRIRSEFVLSGQRFSTKSDSETALYQYQRHGLDFPSALRGEFALALFDAEKERLVLVRDRFGVKPLYFHLTPQLLV